jgi:DNA adenine methylase
MRTASATLPRPLLKWAGGKRQLLPVLRTFYPEAFSGYIEPFLGSGAVFFDLFTAGRISGQRVCLADGNPDLVGCYREIRDRPQAVIDALRGLADAHTRCGESFYYEIRDERFNPARAAGTPYSPELAAMFIYLNRTGYNGLFRVNRRGRYNVPAGRYANPTICNEPKIRAVSAALRTPGISLKCQSFDASLADAGTGDFVYCDPPYAPLSSTSRFAHYTAGGFSAGDQAQLQRALIAASDRGAVVVLSNSSAPEIERLYGNRTARAAGLTIHRVPARRAINSRPGGRGVVDELLVTNSPVSRTGRPRMLKATLPVVGAGG